MIYDRNYRGEITPYENKYICTIQKIYGKRSFKTEKARWIHGYLVKDIATVEKLYGLVDTIIKDRKEVFNTIYTQYPQHVTYHNPLYIIPTFEEEIITINIPETILTRVAVDFKLSTQPDGKRITVSTGLSNIPTKYPIENYLNSARGFLPFKILTADRIDIKDIPAYIELLENYDMIVEDLRDNIDNIIKVAKESGYELIYHSTLPCSGVTFKTGTNKFTCYSVEEALEELRTLIKYKLK